MERCEKQDCKALITKEGHDCLFCNKCNKKISQPHLCVKCGATKNCDHECLICLKPEEECDVQKCKPEVIRKQISGAFTIDPGKIHLMQGNMKHMPVQPNATEEQKFAM